MSQISIIGAGATGLSLAIELVKNNFKVRIFDKSDAPREKFESRAIGTHARTMEIFERFGVLDEMLDCGLRWRNFNIHANNKRIGTINFERIASKFNFALIIPQAETERVLEAKLNSLGVSVERGFELINLNQIDEKVFATLRNGKSETKLVGSSFLIGCDGARSATRKLLKLDFVGKQLQNSFLMDCEIEWNQTPLSDGNTFLDFGRRLIIGQLPQNRWRVVLNFNGDKEKYETPTLETMQNFVDEFGVKARLMNQTWASSFNLSVRRTLTMRVGNIFLAGDSAHNVCPNAGQGLNAGVHDAICLANKLRLFCKTNDENALEDYEKMRSPVIKKLLNASERMEMLMTLENKFAAKARNFALPILTKSSFVTTKIANQVAGVNLEIS
ncbi:MAG: FAD-dependent monooxygenase [Pyrinomonadaceae bacterium]|nr:FAD-dependent monooxygenase [Pyrinomonadaceae bacterium]